MDNPSADEKAAEQSKTKIFVLTPDKLKQLGIAGLLNKIQIPDNSKTIQDTDSTQNPKTENLSLDQSSGLESTIKNKLSTILSTAKKNAISDTSHQILSNTEELQIEESLKSKNKLNTEKTVTENIVRGETSISKDSEVAFDDRKRKEIQDQVISNVSSSSELPEVKQEDSSKLNVQHIPVSKPPVEPNTNIKILEPAKGTLKEAVFTDASSAEKEVTNFESNIQSPNANNSGIILVPDLQEPKLNKNETTKAKDTIDNKRIILDSNDSNIIIKEGSSHQAHQKSLNRLNVNQPETNTNLKILEPAKDTLKEAFCTHSSNAEKEVNNFKCNIQSSSASNSGNTLEPNLKETKLNKNETTETQDSTNDKGITDSNIIMKKETCLENTDTVAHVLNSECKTDANKTTKTTSAVADLSNSDNLVQKLKTEICKKIKLITETPGTMIASSGRQEKQICHDVTKEVKEASLEKITSSSVKTNVNIPSEDKAVKRIDISKTADNRSADLATNSSTEKSKSINTDQTPPAQLEIQNEEKTGANTNQLNTEKEKSSFCVDNVKTVKLLSTSIPGSTQSGSNKPTILKIQNVRLEGFKKFGFLNQITPSKSLLKISENQKKEQEPANNDNVGESSSVLPKMKLDSGNVDKIKNSDNLENPAVQPAEQIKIQNIRLDSFKKPLCLLKSKETLEFRSSPSPNPNNRKLLPETSTKSTCITDCSIEKSKKFVSPGIKANEKNIIKHNESSIQGRIDTELSNDKIKDVHIKQNVYEQSLESTSSDITPRKSNRVRKTTYLEKDYILDTNINFVKLEVEYAAEETPSEKKKSAKKKEADIIYEEENLNTTSDDPLNISSPGVALKKKRGRPRKQQNEYEHNLVAEDTTLLPKKPRGRPRKIPLVINDSSEGDILDSSANLSVTEENALKRKNMDIEIECPKKKYCRKLQESMSETEPLQLASSIKHETSEPLHTENVETTETEMAPNFFAISEIHNEMSNNVDNSVSEHTDSLDIRDCTEEDFNSAVEKLKSKYAGKGILFRKELEWCKRIINVYFSKQSIVRCGKCDKEVPSNKWHIHNLKHSNLGWRLGEPEIVSIF